MNEIQQRSHQQHGSHDSCGCASSKAYFLAAWQPTTEPDSRYYLVSLAADKARQHRLPAVAHLLQLGLSRRQLLLQLRRHRLPAGHLQLQLLHGALLPGRLLLRLG